MTRQKTFKRRVRARMAKTGESYTAARRILVTDGPAAGTGAPAWKPPVADERVAAATGRGWQEWFAMLDAWDAAGRGHTEIARWLTTEQGVAGWWAQSLTVGYEQARGLRAPGQRANGWAISASRTVAVPVARLFEAFFDEELRSRWLPGADLRVRTATHPRSARCDWGDGATRVNVWFAALEDGRSRVTLAHERLPDAEAAEALKPFWRERLVALKALLEGEAS